MVGAIAAVAAVFAGVTVAAADAPGVAAGGARYADPLGWSFTYPRAMHLERSRSPRFVMLYVSEVTVASFSMRSAIHAGSTPRSAWMHVEPPSDSRGSFPSDGVALRVTYMDGGPVPDLQLPESRFPLRLASFGRSSQYASSTPRPLGRTVAADGRDYSAQAWVGPKASAVQRAALARIVASLAFPRLRAGQTVGYGFRVFQPSRSYPVGSFTRVRVQGQPFYLVHAPDGFYAVGWTWQSLTGGYKSHCDLRLDRVHKQFFCTNMAARWDRVGRVLAKPPGATRGDPLNVAVVKIAWDGHVLLFPGVARFAGALYAHQLWPAAYPSR
jgi:hypothetical protein